MNRDNSKANQLFLELLTSPGGRDNTSFLADYVRFLLRTGDVAGAERWLAALREREPEAPRTVELHARVLERQGRGDEVPALLKKLVEREFDHKDPKDPRILRQAALILEQLGRPAEAEKMYHRYVSAVGEKQPESTILLANFLARRNRLAEALDALDAVAARCPLERVAEAGVSALRLCEARGPDYRRVERWIDAGLKDRPRSADLLLSLADLRDAEGKYDEAIALYRKVLEVRPDDAVALNNLAWLLALHANQPAEALGLLERAFAVVGPAPQLLDTRAVIRARAGRPQEALQDLEDAVAQSPDGLRYFHLTQVRFTLKDRDGARAAWKNSRDLGIKRYEVHGLEREAYRQIQEEMNAQ